MTYPKNSFALILGGSSGFGLATAKKLATEGLHLAIVHRDRRGAMPRIEQEFEALRAHGVRVLTFNQDALASDSRQDLIGKLQNELGAEGRIRLLLHSIALGNLKPLAPHPAGSDRLNALEGLAGALDLKVEKLDSAVRASFADGLSALHTLAAPTDFGAAHLDDEDFAGTVHNMGSSLWAWVREVLAAGLFADDARVLALTSEGNTIAWRGYAAVSAAKAVLESISRSMALELAPFGIRSNIVQAGITETPASSLIPGIDKLKAAALMRNPMGRLTQPEDVANAISLLCRDEAGWINGTVVRVDGGEHISGGTA